MPLIGVAVEDLVPMMANMFDVEIELSMPRHQRYDPEWDSYLLKRNICAVKHLGEAMRIEVYSDLPAISILKELKDNSVFIDIIVTHQDMNGEAVVKHEVRGLQISKMSMTADYASESTSRVLVDLCQTKYYDEKFTVFKPV